MQRASLWLAAIFFLGCVALGWLVLHQRTEIVQAALERDDFGKAAHKQMVDLQYEVVRLKSDQAQTVTQIAQLKAATTPARESESDHANGMKTIRLSEVIKEYPEYAARYAKDMRRNLSRSYGDLSKLNLAPDQLAKLKDLLVEQQMTNLDAQQAAEAASMEQGSPAWQTAMRQASQDVQQDINGLLGPGGQQSLQQLRSQESFQNQIQNNFAPDFTDAGVPLSAEQFNGLAQAMASGNPTGRQPPGYNDPDPATGLTPRQENMISAAAQVLTPAQLQIFRTDQIQQAQESAIMKQYTQGAKSYMIIN